MFNFLEKDLILRMIFLEKCSSFYILLTDQI